jgi:glycosyltransferase involved in cell wall biosynthesis
MGEILHVVEPTLESCAGHCRSFVENLCRAAAGRGVTIHVWAGRRAELSPIEGVDVTVHRHFFRRLRKVQGYFLYRRLLKGPGRLFVATAGRVDMALVTLAARAPLPPGKAVLFFHWLNESAKKAAFFRESAMRQPAIRILTPVPSVVEPFRSYGFSDVRMVPYPVGADGGNEGPEREFTHLLFAGAPRNDKGFGHVVSLVEKLKAAGETVPFVIQTSGAHYGKVEPAVREQLARLEAIGYAGLRTVPETLSEEAYAALYRGAICIQPYDREKFASSNSGVTLDALKAGAPVVVTAGTMSARIVSEGKAGLTLREPDADGLFGAVKAIRADWPGFRDRAWAAGRRLVRSNDAAKLLEALTG